MTTPEAITTLLTQFGFRWEAQGRGLRPLLTNIPEGSVSCTACGQTRPQSPAWRQLMLCRACYQQYGRTAYHHRTQRRAQKGL